MDCCLDIFHFQNPRNPNSYVLDVLEVCTVLAAITSFVLLDVTGYDIHRLLIYDGTWVTNSWKLCGIFYPSKILPGKKYVCLAMKIHQVLKFSDFEMLRFFSSFPRNILFQTFPMRYCSTATRLAMAGCHWD